MIDTNFSCEQKNIYNLAVDLARSDYTLLSKDELENELRNKIKKEIGNGKTFYQAFRRNSNTIFEIIEEVVNTAVMENVLNSPFIDEFVEIRNTRLGDKNEFYAEGGFLSVATFSGNHWDTNRQSIDVGDRISILTEWAFVHIYEDLERFLLGITTLDKALDKIYKSINKFIKDRIYIQFQNVANSVPSEFSATGNSEEALGSLVDLVAAAGGYSSMTLAGTKGALRKLAGAVPDKMFANSMKEAKAMTGSIGSWEGNPLMVIPQTLKSGTFDKALDDSKVFVIGGDSKPIKLIFEGDTRTIDNTNGKTTNDMSVDLQIQTKIGAGLILPPYFGVFTFA